MAKTKALQLTPQSIACPVCQQAVPLRRETAHMLLHLHDQLTEQTRLLAIVAKEKK